MQPLVTLKKERKRWEDKHLHRAAYAQFILTNFNWKTSKPTKKDKSQNFLETINSYTITEHPSTHISAHVSPAAF